MHRLFTSYVVGASIEIKHRLLEAKSQEHFSEVDLTFIETSNSGVGRGKSDLILTLFSSRVRSECEIGPTFPTVRLTPTYHIYPYTRAFKY